MRRPAIIAQRICTGSRTGPLLPECSRLMEALHLHVHLTEAAELIHERRVSHVVDRNRGVRTIDVAVLISGTRLVIWFNAYFQLTGDPFSANELTVAMLLSGWFGEALMIVSHRCWCRRLPGCRS